MAVKLTTEEFISRSRSVHNDTYMYDRVEYINSTTLVTIICKYHGEFKQIPSNHIAGKGCISCGRERADEAKRIKGRLQWLSYVSNTSIYNYILSDYIDSYHKVTITCSIQGNFAQLPHNHMNGHGCPTCAIELNDIVRRTINTKGTPTLLYYIYLPEYNVWKVGCTTVDLKDRFRRGKEQFIILYTKLYTNSAIAYQVEKYLLFYTKDSGNTGIHIKSKGSSELRSCHIDNIEQLVGVIERELYDIK